VELGDIIVELDGHPVRGEADLLTLLQRYDVGDVVRVRVLRGKGYEELAVELQERYR
jgi:S1-C subfamily serine protease